MLQKTENKTRIEWADALKAFAILGILLNHLMEEFGPGAWFTNPSETWPSFALRIEMILPAAKSLWLSFVYFMGWLGDSGPGMFILLSGFSLTFSVLQKNSFKTSDFYKKRLLRIFPLYIVISLITIFFSIFIKGNAISISNPKTFLSIIGLRFNDSLFFYINPSWWFIWLILQLYIIFPLLYWLLNKWKLSKFIWITFIFTFLSRFLGIEGIRYSHSLYYWMTGIFFGTRLAEFTAGMGLAVLFCQKGQKIYYSTYNIFLLCILAYLAGLMSSITLTGSIFSNLLVSIGLCGIFYTLWEKFFKDKRILNKSLIWLGINAYGIFLLHQTPLKWTSILFRGSSHFAAALMIILISIPLSWLIDKGVNHIINASKNITSRKLPTIINYSLCFVLLILLSIAEPHIINPIKHELLMILLFMGMATIIILTCKHFYFINIFLQPVPWTIALILFVYLYLFPMSFGNLAPVFFVIVYLISIACILVFKNRALFSITASAIASIIFFISSEYLLTRYAPIEGPHSKWGEYPALQINPTTTYSLIPNKTTHLRYNNYNYTIQTNSFGLNSPEIAINKPANCTRILVIGDAFSMPEGVNYVYSYPALLEKKLQSASKQKIEVINAGTTGYGPAEEYPQLKKLALLFHPDIVLYQFFINEFEECILKPQERLENIGLQTHENYKERIIFNSQLIAHLLKIKIEFLEKIKGKPQPWREEKSFLYYYKVKDQEVYDSRHINKLRFYLAGMKEFSDSIQAKFIILFVPGAVAVSKTSDIHYLPLNINLKDTAKYDLDKPFKKLKKITDPNGIPVIDLTYALKSNPVQPVYFPDSWHWDKEGHRVVADTLAHFLITKYFRRNGN